MTTPIDGGFVVLALPSNKRKRGRILAAGRTKVEARERAANVMCIDGPAIRVEPDRSCGYVGLVLGRLIAGGRTAAEAYAYIDRWGVSVVPCTERLYRHAEQHGAPDDYRRTRSGLHDLREVA